MSVQQIQIKQKLELIEERISRALSQSRRSRKDVLLLPVTKYQSIETIKDLLSLGFSEFGESQVQMLLEKDKVLSDQKIMWHYIGHLQSNKLKALRDKAKLIHSVDRFKLIEKLSEISDQQDILLQINITKESSKHGFLIEESELAVQKILEKSSLRLVGLMTMAQKKGSGKSSRDCFAKLYKLRDRLEREFSIQLPELSMGMSQDYEEAILEGSTIIRVGSDLFKDLV